MQADLLFQIAGVGVLTTVVSAVLASSGRSDWPTWPPLQAWPSCY